MEYITNIFLQYYNILEQIKNTKIDEYRTYTLQTIDQVLHEQILTHLFNNQFYSIYIVGSMGSGKTTLAKNITRPLTTYFRKTNYTYRIIEIGGKSTENYEQTLTDVLDVIELQNKSSMKEDIYIFILDDYSYKLTANIKENQYTKNIYTKIRHKVQGKVLTIIIGHLEKAVPPIFRASNCKLYTTLSEQELGTLNALQDKTIASKKNVQLTIFKKLLTDKQYLYYKNGIQNVITLEGNERPVLFLANNDIGVAKFINETKWE